MKLSAPLLLSLLLLAPPVLAQSPDAPHDAPHGRALTHDDYESWNALRGVAYSHDGKWIAYQVEPVFGDGELIIRQTEGNVVHRRPLASGARFSAGSRYVAFTVGKSKVEAREKQIAELRKKGKSQESGAAAETARGGRGGLAGRRAGGGATPTAAPTAGRRGAGGRGRGGRGGRGGGAGDSGGSGDLFLLDLESGKVESIGKVSRWTLSSDVALLLYQMSSSPADEEGSDADETPAAGARGAAGAGARGAAGAGARGAAAVAEAAKLPVPVANAQAANVLAASAQLVPAVVTRARRIDVQPAPNW